ncbi:putative bifunctional diguanylate cyclase/phosphodiesterase [Hydrogenophaga sp. OTU3427]|uniref:putative bifunctional diguanylate cyclase/phosphodiesterase n=1 Tax=Hydrogenophaga sp. OTU3427 TaxID=3043856 RepID=UPI00313AC35B
MRDLPLSTRTVVVMLLLLLLVQAVGFVIVRATVESQARQAIAGNLQVGERVWLRLLEQNADRLRQASSVLAADFGFRSAVGTGDKATIQSALQNSGSRIGAAVTALLDPGAQALVASGTADGGMADEALLRVGADLARDRGRNRIARINRVPYQFVMVPVRAPAIIGWVLMGFPIDQALADDLFRLSSVHVAVLSGTEAQRLGMVVSTLSGHEPELAEVSRSMAPDVVLGRDTYVVRHVELDTSGGVVRTVLMRSVVDAVEPYVQLQLLLALVAAGGVVLFAAGSGLVMRRVTQPLKTLTEATTALQQGNYAADLGNMARGDEVGQLARGFDRMRTSLAEQRREILQLAYWDRLTGLPNRERFREALVHAIEDSRGSAKPLAVITLNVDRFKHVNDVLGYAFGDELLKAVAERLKQQVYREGDLVARLGGDEFAILLSRTDAQGAVMLTERVARAFELPLAFDEQTVDLSASMGVACWPGDADEPDLLMSRSEIAMHAAKSKTAGVLLYSPSLDSASTQTLSLLTDLRHALQHNELRLFLQPKLDTASERVVAAEALVRWQHPQRGLVPPLQFIPFAEQTGFVRQLTLWMFEEAARHWAALQPAQGLLRIAINLSTRDLLDQDFPLRLAALLRQYGVLSSGFCLEITESAIMDDPQRAEATLNKLAAQGFKLSIDDFGTGYSSLAYLKRLPVNELKIDKSFVMGMEADESDAKIVRSTIDLAHNLGLSVVAEGVENAAVLGLLRELGCDEVQGYFVSKPLPAVEFNGWRARWESRAA